MIDISAALPTFVVTLREGVEATLVVGIVLTYLYKVERTTLARWVYWGVAAGIAASVLVGVGFIQVLQGVSSVSNIYTPIIKPLLEAGFSLVAIVLLSWMLVWMTQQGRTMKAGVETQLSSMINTNRAGWGLFTLVLVAVLREGFETVVFLAAQFQQDVSPLLGAVSGLLVAVGFGVLLVRFGIRVNLRQFFQVMGILLLLIVAGLVVGMLHHLDEAAMASARSQLWFASVCTEPFRSCLLGPQVWDAAAILPDKQFPGVLLKALFGYRQELYTVQLVAYSLFLVGVGGLYLQQLMGRSLWSWLRSLATKAATDAEGH